MMQRQKSLAWGAVERLFPIVVLIAALLLGCDAAATPLANQDAGEETVINAPTPPAEITFPALGECPERTLQPPAALTTFDPIDSSNWLALSDDGLILLAPPSKQTQDMLPQRLHPLSKLGLDGVDHAFAWSPSSQQIAFLYTTPEPLACARGYLMLADLRLGTVRPLLEEPSAIGIPVWSPDGKHIALTDQSGALWVLEIATQAARIIQRDAQVGIEPVWLTADQLLYVQARLESTETVVALQKLEGGDAQVYLEISGLVRDLTVAANKNQIAYYARALFVGTLEPFTTELISTEPKARLQWSPNGQHLLALGGMAGVFLVTEREPDVISQLPIMGLLANQAWSPDGTQFVFLSQPVEGIPTISFYSIESGQQTDMAYDIKSVGDVVWSPQ